MKRILVTGGAGFIGCHLCHALLDRGHHVVCLDDLSTASPANLDALRNRAQLEFIRQDVATLKGFVNIDEIYNLACPASPERYQRNPMKTWKTSVLGMLCVVELAREIGAKVLQASTSEVYGDPMIHPQDETYFGNVNPIGPRACYDEGKRAAETLCADCARQYALHVQIARIFNTYGPGMHPYDGRLLSNLVRQALRGENLTIYGDGSQTRSFCYVDDLVDGLIRLMEIPGEYIGPVNLGNPEEFTVLQAAAMVRQIVPGAGEIDFRPLPADDPRQRRPVIDKAVEHLHWRPETHLEEGLVRMIHWAQRSGWARTEAPVATSRLSTKAL